MKDKLTPKQKAFADYYIETGNATESAKRAGYKCYEQQGKENLRKPTISAYISERVKPINDNRIATGDEVMKFFSAMMRGDIKDAFGLDASNTDRMNAAKELAKRTVDIGGHGEEYESDCFMDALKGQVKETFKDSGDIVET